MYKEEIKKNRAVYIFDRFKLVEYQKYLDAQTHTHTHIKRTIHLHKQLQYNQNE